MKKPVVTGGALWNPSEKQTTYDPPVDPLNPGPWRLLNENEDYRYWVALVEDGSAVIKTEHKGTEQLLEDNQRAYNDSAGQRWGDGKVVSSIPTNIWFKELAEAKKQHDTPYIRRWLNDIDHRKFRKFKGTI